MGSPVLVTGKVSGFIGNVPEPPGGSQGATKWGHRPRRAAWAKCGRGPAPGGLVCPPQGPKAPRVWGRGRTHLTWGASFPSSPLGHPQMGSWAGRRPLGGRSPPSPPIYSGGKGASQHTKFFSCWRSPASLSPPLPRCFVKLCWIATLFHHHHAVVLLLDGFFLNLSLSPCWIKAWETSPGCTCVERGGAVRSALGHR